MRPSRKRMSRASALLEQHRRKEDVDGRVKPGHDEWKEAVAYTGSPFCFASSFSETCGRAPMCWITSAAANAPSRPQAS